MYVVSIRAALAVGSRRVRYSPIGNDSSRQRKQDYHYDPSEEHCAEGFVRSVSVTGQWGVEEPVI